MHIQDLRRSASRLAIVVALGGLALAGCNRAQTNAPQAQDAAQAPPPLAALPMTNAEVALAPAPPADALPAAPRARVARLPNRRDDYAFAERAYGLNRAFGDAPPDYTFDYNGVRPWVWSSDSNDVRVVEPLEGGDRYYYYQPGADAPYLVRDPEYSYGYDDGQLVVVYDRGGRALDPYETERLSDRAGRYLARAEALYQASREQRREAVAEANWRDRREALAAERTQWADDAQRDQDWRAYHDAHDAEEQAHWDNERFRRQAEAARFAQNINDTALANREWQAARDAQARVQTRGRGPNGQAFNGQGGVVAPPQGQPFNQHANGFGGPPPMIPGQAGPVRPGGPPQPQVPPAMQQQQAEAARLAMQRAQAAQTAGQAAAAQKAQAQAAQQARAAQAQAAQQARAAQQAQAAQRAQAEAAARSQGQARAAAAQKAQVQALQAQQAQRAQAEAAAKAQALAAQQATQRAQGAAAAKAAQEQQARAAVAARQAQAAREAQAAQQAQAAQRAEAAQKAQAEHAQAAAQAQAAARAQAAQARAAQAHAAQAEAAARAQQAAAAAHAAPPAQTRQQVQDEAHKRQAEKGKGDENKQ